MNSRERSLCVLRAEVSDSARVYQRIGKAEADYAIERCLKRIERAVAMHGGRVLRVSGPELTAAFPTAESALQAACDMQERVGDLPPTSGQKLSVCVGFHVGETEERGQEIAGEAAETALRLAQAAKGGQILTSGSTAALLPTHLRRITRAIEAAAARKLNVRAPVAEVLCHEAAAPVVKAPILPNMVPAGRLVLRHGGSEFVLEGSRNSACFGRDTTNDIVVGDRRASRNHARIERRRDRFVLIDLSTNGTFVTFEGELEIALKHEEVVLKGKGTISFGHSHQGPGVETAAFEVMG